ncbi:MAG TPA: hydrophobe/amphiphile efflux-3 (HAE3) family transporter [Acidimicrobiales bacterium]|nr:hydrophobe/amphiphile efflux-3 (HAE3) family transporter [Acidimicrobiales bacterium]
MDTAWKRVAATITGHPARVLLGTAAVIALLAFGLPRLEFVTGQETLVDPGSAVFRTNERYQASFGGEPMLVLLTGDIRAMSTGPALDELAALEDDLRDTGEFAAVLGPATALEFAAAQLAVAPDMITAATDRDAAAAAAAARAAAAEEGGTAAEQEAAASAADAAVRADRAQQLGADTARLGAAGEQSLDNPAFTEFLLFGNDGEIRPALRDNFLDAEHGLIVVRLPGNASIEEQSRGADVVDEVVARHDVPGVETLASGSPVLLAEINDYLRSGMATLGAIAVGVMALVLVLVFRVRWRLLPLLVVLVGTVGAFGAVGLAGISLTLVTISGLPILIGLGVDFAIQMHNRFEEERGEGHPVDAAAGTTVRRMGPPLALAMVAAVAGFLALLWSAVPMLKDFGLLLSVGVAVLVLVALLAPVAVLVLRDRRGGGRPVRPRRAVEAGVRRLSSLPARVAVPLLVAAAAIVGAGLVAEAGLTIQTDPERWIDQDGRAVTDLEALREGTGFSSELTILVEADDVTDPAIVEWMNRFGSEAVDRHPALLRATSLPAIASGVHGSVAGGDDVRQLLTVASEDISRTFVSPDRTQANLVFPIAPVSLDEREALLDELETELRGDLAPPSGVAASATGLAVNGIELVNGLEDGRGTLSLIALAFVLAWLLVAQRDPVRSVLILVPVITAVGLSSLAIRVLGIDLTPLTTVAGPLVIAVGTEFSVLVVARYAEERARGSAPREAVTSGVPRIGRAFVASGLTLIGGFGVLAFSAMPLLRDFGVVVALDVLFALVSTLVVLPPLLVWSDGHGWLHRLGGAGRPAARRRGVTRPGPTPVGGRT